MRFCSPKRLWLALLLLSVAAGGVRGQWRIVAPNLAKVNNYNGDAMSFCDGIVWIVADAIYMSTDSGVTWISKKLPIAKFYYDIQFYNQTEGVLATDSLTWITSDAGASWQQLSPGSTSACFLNGFNSIAISGGVTTDGGLSWNGFPRSSFVYSVRYKNGTIYEFAESTSFFGSIFTSTDFGSTWQQGKTPIDEDSWSFAIDSCDANRIYLSHEDMGIATDQYSKIFLTTDRGDTWQTIVSQPRPFFSGSIAEGKSTVYCQSTSNGVFRSTDRGITWGTIGGPSVGVDSRLIAALSDNLLLAVDSKGSVWRTDNSGGDSVINPSPYSSFLALPKTAFLSDTISCDSITRSVLFDREGCPPQPDSILGWSIIGIDSARYRASNISYDSIQVTLYGTKQGNQNAKLILYLDNGMNDTVSLAGYVDITHSDLTFSIPNVQTDTLGATVSVPIMLNGLEHAEDVDLVLHYDGTVQYLGSFSPTGVRLDVPGDSSLGRSVLAMTGATSGAVLGYAKFNVFNDSNEAAHATFDSVTVLTQLSPCEYSAPAPATSTITTLSGCAIPMLSQFFHLGKDPTFSIVPNPTNGNVWITSSDDLGVVTIEVYDMLGTMQSEISGQISKNNPFELLLPEQSGVYNIVLRTTLGTRTERVVRIH